MSVDAYGGSGTKNMYHVWPTDLDEQPLAYMENEGFGFTLGSVSCRYGTFGCVCVVRSGSSQPPLQYKEVHCVRNPHHPHRP